MSDKVTRGLLEVKDGYFVKNNSSQITNERVDKWELFVRKSAHFALFAWGGFVICLFLSSIIKSKHTFLISIFLGMLLACIDEFHQLYSLNRGPSLSDVGIDSLGIISGVLLATIGTKLMKEGKKIYDKLKRSHSRKDCKSS